MATRSRERHLQPSVLDRLLGTAEGERAGSLNQSVESMKRALLRDLEWLLNTRRIARPAGEDFPEVRRSVYHYGLRDVSSLSADAPAVRGTLAREVEELLRLFEPRLTGVRVSIPDEAEAERRQIRFVIEATLDVDPHPVPVLFDTVLEVSRGEFSVKED